MKISAEAIEAACRVIFGHGWPTHTMPIDRQRVIVGRAIVAALLIDGCAETKMGA